MVQKALFVSLDVHLHLVDVYQHYSLLPATMLGNVMSPHMQELHICGLCSPA